MPTIHPIPAVTYAATQAAATASTHAPADITPLIAPPYDVLDAAGKARLQARDEHNIVTIDLPHLPAKTVGPQATYDAAADTYRQWLKQGVFTQQPQPAIFVYTQTFTARGRTYNRRGLIANLPIQPFGPAPDGQGGIFPHEQTFSGPKEDRLRLMRASRCQFSPIFGLYRDDDSAGGQTVGDLLTAVITAQPADFIASSDDGVRHEVRTISDPATISRFAAALAGRDVYIADGHHRYTTALNYLNELRESGKPVPPAAQRCMFVLVAIEDPGMIILPTHRLLGGMTDFSMARFTQAARGLLNIQPFNGSLAELEQALPQHGPHAIGLYDATQSDPHQRLWLATTVAADPLAEAFPKATAAWRNLDVAIAQHLIVERICEPTFCTQIAGAGGGGKVSWQFPHTLADLEAGAKAGRDQAAGQLGLVMQPTPLAAIGQVSAAGELMPQKSTFFYPKLATGLVLNPLE
jgi:uncharacterized protein (DUF1015 family)